MKTTSRLAAAVALVLVPASTGAAQLPLLPAKCFGMIPTIVGTEGDDTLVGTSGGDVISGLDGGDVILGLGGRDAICGGAGADEITGGADDDAIAVGRGADVARGGDGLDVVVEFASDSCGPCLPADAASRDDSVDHVYGGPGPDIVSGEGGNDVIDGGEGQDVAVHISRFTSVAVDLSVGKAVSSAGDVDELKRIEHVLGSVNSDTLRGDAGRNSLMGSLGKDFIDGGDGPDVLHAVFYGSTLVGGADESPDTIRVAMMEPALVNLAAGVAASREPSHLHTPDTIVGFENVVGTPYEDVVVGDEGPNLLEGGYGDDEVSGAGGDDYVFGDDLRQTFYWGAVKPGNDVLDGGLGSDRLDGGPLVDECRNGEAHVSCEKRDGSREAPGAEKPASARRLPWWWDALDIDHLHDAPGLRTTVLSLR